jgi:hypothetical protein
LRFAPALLLTIAVMLGAFSYWGMMTDAGRHAFDEMDGLHPFYAGTLAVVALLLSIAWIAIRSRD